MGRLTHEPELRTTTTDKLVMRFSLAVARSRASPEGVRETDFITCIAWNQTAEFIHKYFTKGDPIAIQGYLQTRSYQDKQGNNRKAWEVIIREVNFCAFKKDESQNTNPVTPQSVTPDNPHDVSSINMLHENLMDLSDQDLPF
jgi:single-strand DNA-binding protein